MITIDCQARQAQNGLLEIVGSLLCPHCVHFSASGKTDPIESKANRRKRGRMKKNGASEGDEEEEYKQSDEFLLRAIEQW